MVNTANCPCGSNKHYKECCKAFHDGEQIAETAELLMRSRYSAYVKNNKEYLLQTWHESTRPKPEDLHLDSNSEFRWLELKVVNTEAGQKDDTEGLVHFQAKYRLQGQTGFMDESSKFVKENSQWFYIEGN